MARTALSLLILVIAASVPRVRSNSCEEVWFEDAKFDGEPSTCGERIVFLQTPQGGLLTEQEARVKAALENDICADCWPWEKYREDGNTERSAKRGIAIENHMLTAEMLSGLSHIISWGATWDYKLQGGPSLDVWNAAGIEFYPMIWGDGTIAAAEANGIPEGSRALLGFNEPNFPEQANLHPYWAAYYWKDVERIAELNNITTIVSPSMNYHWSFDPIDWLYQFFYHCEGCKVDAIGLHVFSCYANGLKYHLDRYRVFGKPMWVTEIACSDPHSPERLSAEGQMAYMREAIPLLEADEDVEMYAWFSYFKDEWDHPIVDGENGDAGLIHPNGTLTNLGKLFETFAAGSNLTEINITVPEWKNETNETSSTTTTESETLTTTKSATTSVSETATSSTTGSETWSSTLTESTTTVTSSLTATGTDTSTRTGSTTTVSSSKTDTTTQTDTSTSATTTRSSSSSSTQSSSATSSTATSSTKTWSGETSSTTVVTVTDTSVTATATVTSTVSATETSATDTATATSTGSTTLSVTNPPEVATTAMSTTATTTATLAVATATGTTTLSITEWAMPASTKTLTTTRTLSATVTTTWSTSATRTTKMVEAPITTVAEATTVTGTATWTGTSTTDNLDSANTTTEHAHTNYTSSRHLTGTAPSTTMTQGGESTTYTLDEEDNTTNDTELTCGEAVEAWCQSDPEAAPFFPLRHCSDWRLHDAMCTSPVGGGQAAPQFSAGTTLQEGSPLSVLFLIMAVIGAAMASAALTSAFHRQRCLWLRFLCCCQKRREDEEQEDLKRAVSEKDWPGRCLNVMGKNASVAPAPEGGVLLPVEALARRVGSSPMAGCEGSPVRGTFSKGANNLSEVAVGTPVGTTPASRAAALHTLQEAMAMATAEDATWDEKQVALDQVGRLLAGGATANLPMTLRQEAEAWQCRQDERLRLARSLEAAAEKAAALEDGAREAMGEDGTTSDVNPLRELMARAKLSVDAGDREAMLAEAARRASTFQEELDAQRLRLQARRKQSDADSSLLTAGALLEERDALAGLKDKVAAEFAALPGLREDGAGDEAWDSACDALEEAWKHLSADVQSATQEAQSALTATLGGSKVAKSLEDTDAERRAALAEAARRAAAFDEELQKQKQKLQKRAKGKGSQAAALELGRLLEDKEAYEALESERAAALEECQKFMADGKMSESEANDWAQLVEALDAAKADLAELAPETSAEALPKSSTWAAIAAKVKTGKLEDSQEQMAMLAEATRRAAAFDEELQKQRSQMKKRRKALQKGATPDQVDPLEACRTLADEQTLKKLAKEQAEACAQCEALAASAEGDTKEAWTELGAAWAGMSKDMAKAEKEARESAKVVTGEAGSGLSEALGLVDEATGGDMAGGSSRRLVEDDGDARRAALQEAARRIATFDEELAKQKAAMRRRRTEASGATALGHALRDGAALRGLSEATAEQRAACEAAIQAAREEGGAGAAAWEDLAQVWGKLQEDVAEATKEAEADAEEACGDVAEISHHLVFRGLAAAARRAAAFERKLQTLRREGTALAGADELRDGLRTTEVQKLRQELAEGTRECEEGISKVPGDAAETHAAESRAAWQELLNLWQELASDLESLGEAASAPASASATSLRKVFDTSVDDSEKQTALALAARRALQFDEELQRQRQRLVRRKNAPKEADAEAEVPEPAPAECLRALGDAVALQALASESEVAAAGCREALARAEAEQKWEEVQGWKQIIQVYESGRAPLEEAKQEVEAAGGLSSQADRVAGHRLVHQVAKDQKTSAEACLKAVEKALNTDSGPLEELIEAQQQARSVKSNGGSTRRSRGAEVAAQVQTWDVLEEAQGMLNALKSGEAKGDTNSAEAMQVLKRLGDEAAKQLDAISSTQVKEAKEKPEQKDAGCQTIFRLGGMAWHANPAVQKLLEDLMKVSTQGPTADPDQVDKLDDEVSVIMEKWRKTFIERNRQRGNSLRRQPPPEIHAMPPAQVPAAAPTAPQAPPVMLEADLVARAAAKKLEAPPPEAPAWSSVKRDEVKMTVEPSSFQSSTFDSSLPGRMPEAEADTSRQGSAERSTSPGAPVPTSGRIPHSSEHRRPRAGSEDAQVPSPEKSGQSSEPLASRSRRRRDSESSNFQWDVSGGSVPSCSETPLHPGMPNQTQAGSSEAKTDVLAQLGQIRQSQHAPSSRAASKEEPREDPPTGRPSSAVGHRGGPGDSSLLVPPVRDASRSVSPSSSVGSSSVSSGHRRPVLDPIARPRGPPLPSAGRLLLATAQQESRETSPHSARSGPAAP